MDTVVLELVEGERGQEDKIGRKLGHERDELGADQVELQLVPNRSPSHVRSGQKDLKR